MAFEFYSVSKPVFIFMVSTFYSDTAALSNLCLPFGTPLLHHQLLPPTISLISSPQHLQMRQRLEKARSKNSQILEKQGGANPKLE